YIDASESVKDELYRLAEKYSKDGVLSLSDMHKQNRLTELNGEFEKIIEDLGHSTEAFAKINMQDGFRKVYADTAESMGDIDFSMPNKKLREKLMETP
ncbi:phage head morphogenesis protein, partial [[Ruminococcus] torques]|nr:phage head morphogenesis protein [[Ruminococcus] torques]